MQSLSHFSKALTVGVVASLLVLASANNQVALGAARATSMPVGITAVAQESGFWADFLAGFRAALNQVGVTESQEQHTLVAMEHYQSADFSQFDGAPM
ncbi:hypothetical protein QMK33_18420 [Hymenobacter sp. H14-R3]|uniref:hypothetical protein n=1 Tax=Hymenobacter sp. H14-R3 TaxID=3046308 RepID=UPI0024B913BC|nr:hypothetical protein [Hymenobacter sp. H14-R3]MDJ0367130.1 hypothetical protein [Hymenobacter sp. H14-R3]